MTRRPLLPPTYFLLALMLMAGLHVVIPLREVVGWPWRWLGAVPVLTGAALNVLCSRLFERHGTTVKPFEESTVFVVDGPFRYSRNPMYLGMLLILLGISVSLGSLTPLIVLPLFGWLITVRFIVPEERALARRFPSDYPEYEKRVRRWL